MLSDIHGVLPALDAVLAEPAVRAAERIVVTGDHAAGPQPVAGPRPAARASATGWSWCAATPTANSSNSPPVGRRTRPGRTTRRCPIDA